MIQIFLLVIDVPADFRTTKKEDTLRAGSRGLLVSPSLGICWQVRPWTEFWTDGLTRVWGNVKMREEIPPPCSISISFGQQQKNKHFWNLGCQPQSLFVCLQKQIRVKKITVTIWCWSRQHWSYDMCTSLLRRRMRHTIDQHTAFYNKQIRMQEDCCSALELSTKKKVYEDCRREREGERECEI